MTNPTSPRSEDIYIHDRGDMYDRFSRRPGDGSIPGSVRRAIRVLFAPDS